MKTKNEIAREIAEKVRELDLLTSQWRITPDSLPEPDKQWPQVGDGCFLIRGDGELDFLRYCADPIDAKYVAHRGLFRTEAEARRERDYLQLERDVRAKAKELNGGWAANWGVLYQEKWQIIFESDITIDQWPIYNFSLVRGSECKSREAAQALLDYFGTDKFLAYATGGEL